MNELFNALGDGRNYHFEESAIEKHSLYPPRGLPPRFGFAVMNRFFHIVDDHADQRDLRPDLRTISQKEADEWLMSGKSIIGPPFVTFSSNHGERELRRVSSPDWHSASWLMLEEVHESLAHFNSPIEKATPEVQATLQVMEAFETHYGKGHSRLVFWFDN